MLTVDEVLQAVDKNAHPLHPAQVLVAEVRKLREVNLLLQEENERLKTLRMKRDQEHLAEMASYRLKVRSQDEATFAAQRDLLRVQKEEIEHLRKNAAVGAAIDAVRGGK